MASGGAAAHTWLAEREVDLPPVVYFHVVFTLPVAIADVAFQNTVVVYDLLFRAELARGHGMHSRLGWPAEGTSETMLTIAADPKHLGAWIGITAVPHTCGGACQRLRSAKLRWSGRRKVGHDAPPAMHMIVPGGGLSRDGTGWISARPAFLLPVRVLGKLFRCLFLTRLTDLHDAGKLTFFGSQAELADRRRFLRHLAPVRRKRWVIYAKAPFAGPEAVLA